MAGERAAYLSPMKRRDVGDTPETAPQDSKAGGGKARRTHPEPRPSGSCPRETLAAIRETVEWAMAKGVYLSSVRVTPDGEAEVRLAAMTQLQSAPVELPPAVEGVVQGPMPRDGNGRPRPPAPNDYYELFAAMRKAPEGDRS